jgi:hypothetical protein
MIACCCLRFRSFIISRWVISSFLNLYRLSCSALTCRNTSQDLPYVFLTKPFLPFSNKRSLFMAIEKYVTLDLWPEFIATGVYILGTHHACGTVAIAFRRSSSSLNARTIAPGACQALPIFVESMSHCLQTCTPLGVLASFNFSVRLFHLCISMKLLK